MCWKCHELAKARTFLQGSRVRHPRWYARCIIRRIQVETTCYFEDTAIIKAILLCTCFSGHVNDVIADGGSSTSRSPSRYCELLPQMRSNAQSVKESLHCLLTIRMRLIASLIVEEVNGHAQVVRRIQKSRIGIVTLSLDRPP